MYWDVVRSQMIEIEVRKNIRTKCTLKIWSIRRMSIFMYSQNRKKKNKTEGSVEEPTQSLLNKKDVFTFTIYSKLDPAAQAVNTEKSVR